MRFVRKISNYPERITLSGLTYMMSMVDLVAINVETLTIDCRCSFMKELTKLFHMNP